MAPRRAPRCQTVIQLCYVNSFGSIWEYASAARDGTIAYESAIGVSCPICGGHPCHRPIAPYNRWVVELFPFRRERVPVARFQCRRTLKTFSMLPFQLAPYHQYTVATMLTALVLAQQVLIEDGKGLGQTVLELPVESLVTTWLLRCWLGKVLKGLRRAHAELAVGHDLVGICTGRGLHDDLSEVRFYLTAFSGRGPPGCRSANHLIEHHARRTRRFLVGAPSHVRGR